MKKFLLMPFFLFFLSSCEENKPLDRVVPEIKLIGDEVIQISLNSAFQDLGASAFDNIDGDISSSIVVSGVINTNLVGDYNVQYDVEDKSKNKAIPKVRVVKVRNDADKYSGRFSSTYNCSFSGDTPTDDDITTSSNKNKRIQFSLRFFDGTDYQSAPVYADISGSTIQLPLQGSGQFTVVGSGKISSSDKLSFDYQVNGAAPYSCKAEFKRK
jgi:hypothetical protein